MLPSVKPHLEITIVGGKMTVDAIGFEGKGCQELTQLFAKMGQITEEHRKPDFFKGTANGAMTKIITR